MRWNEHFQRSFTDRSKTPSVRSNRIIIVFALLINLALPVLVLNPPDENGLGTEYDIEKSEVYLSFNPVINEVYPEPAHDTNHDGEVDTLDEFIEIFNPNDQAIELLNWSISDNYGNYKMDRSWIGPQGRIVLWRNETSLKLGRDDLLILRNENGTVIDELVWSNHRTGFSIQRAPDGNSTIREVYYPTPGRSNLGIPAIKINEVMMDPYGSNFGYQWIELVNKGANESLKGFHMTNYDGVEIYFSDHMIPQEHRVLIFLGNAPSDLKIPFNVSLVNSPQTRSLYVNGDDLSLIDPDGRIVDHIAWGGSSHVQKIGSGYSDPEWSGKYWDETNSSMSAEGIDNPVPCEGISLARSPDGADRSSPDDWGTSIGYLEHTMGWSNDIDPTLQINIEPGPIFIEKGSSMNLSFIVENKGNINGSVVSSIICNEMNWSIDDSVTGIYHMEGGGVQELYFEISAPGSIHPDRGINVEIVIFWQDLDFILFEKILSFIIPAADVYLSEVSLNFNGDDSSTIPSGGICNLQGYVNGGGEIDPGNVDLVLSIKGENGSPIHSFNNLTKTYRNMTTRSKRKFDLTIDTLGMSGIFEIILYLRLEEGLEDSDRENDHWSRMIDIVPSIIPCGQMGLKIVEVLWNCSIDQTFVKVINPTDSDVELSGLKISDGMRSVNFPDGYVIGAMKNITVLWSEDSLDRMTNSDAMFSIEKMPNIPQMENDGSAPDLMTSGRIVLQTRYRIEIDQVNLRREIELTGIETTWGSVLYRSFNRVGMPIDTNTSLDWSVYRSHCIIRNFLPEPAPYGAGEFVTLTSSIPDADVSGYLLLCSGRGAVIPNGTIVPEDGSLVIARDPENFFLINERVPDLTTGYEMKVGNVLVPGGKAPNLSELILPNEGSTLYLIDPGNVIIDSISWGDKKEDMIDRPDRDCIIGRIMNGGSATRDWMAVGSGSEWSSIWESDTGYDTSCNYFGSIQNGIEWIFEGEEAVAITPFIENEIVVAHMASHLENGGGLELIFTNEPWTPFVGLDEEIYPVWKRAGIAKFLQKKGTKIRTMDMINGPDEPTIILCDERILFIPGPLSSRVPSRDHNEFGLIGFEIRDNEFINIIHGQIERYRDMASSDLDPLNFIEQISPSIDVLSSENTSVHKHQISLNARLGSLLPQNIEEFSPTGNMLLWSSGPIDLNFLKKIAKNGREVNILLNPSLLRVNGVGSTTFLDREMERLEGDDHLFSMDSLEDNALLRCSALLKTALSSDLEINIRVGDTTLGWKYTTQLFVDLDEIRFPLPRLNNGLFPTSLILEGDMSALLGSTLNTIWEGARPIPMGLIENESDHEIEDSPYIRIQEVYYNTYLPDDPDEYIAIENYGTEKLNLSGFMISDDEGLGLSSDGMVILGDVILRPGEMIFLTRDLQKFYSQNGYLNSVEFTNDSSMLAFSCYGDMRLANSNDSLSLRDEAGNLIDIVTWGKADFPAETWDHYRTGTWIGDPCPDVGWGRILTRTSDMDTNSRIDWLSLRPRYPGQSRLANFDMEQIEDLMMGVCPESSSDVMDHILDDADQEVLVNVYEMTSDWITSRLIGLKGRGVNVKVLLEGNPVGGISWMEKNCIAKMASSGIEVRSMITDPELDIRDRYRYDHAKYIVGDEEMVLVSSDNFKDSSFPPKNSEISYGTRGWVLSGRSNEIAEDLRTIFLSDWDGPDIRIWDVSDQEATLQSTRNLPINGEDRTSMPWSEPLSVETGSEGLILISPDHISQEGNTLLSTIENAEEEILLELMDIDPDYLLNSVPQEMIPPAHLGENFGNGIDVMNPYIKALFNAAERGVDVKLLLDGSDFNGDGIPENSVNMEILNKLATDLGIENVFRAFLHSRSGISTSNDISMIHNKGMIVDRSSVWISSFNWGPTSGLENREVGLLLRSNETAEYLRRCILHDMGTSLQTNINVRKEWIKGDFDSGDLVSIDVCVKIILENEEDFQLELVNINDQDERILDLESIHGPFEGYIILSSGDQAGLNEGDLILRLAQGELRSDLMVIEVSQPQQRSTGHDGAWYGSGWIPIIMILVAALMISLTKAFVSKQKRYEEE